MPIEIIVPRLGWSMEEGAFVAWLKQDGEIVRAGDPLFSIEGDKAVQEIESIDSGILRIAANAPKPGDSIRVGDVLGHLVSAAEPAPGSVAADPGRSVAKPAAGPPQSVAGPAPVIPAPNQTVPRAPGVPAISPRALRVASELGVDWTRLTGSGRAGRIRERDVRAASSSSTSVLDVRASKSYAPAMNPSTAVLRRDVIDIRPWAETCGQIRPLIEEQDGAAAEVHHLEITDAKLHYHERTDEIYYVLDGAGRMRVGDEEIEVHKDVTVYVPRGVKHRAWGNLKVLVVCIPRGVLNDVHEVE